ncbi:hypothetical protein BDQ17DRAFT_1434627 [Cyathus striatus]|nr:hypothetical protein BDQ17DRAFT_1434627 [Cyathus striatus]
MNVIGTVVCIIPMFAGWLIHLFIAAISPHYDEPEPIPLRIVLIIGAIGGSVMFAISVGLIGGGYILCKGLDQRILDISLIMGGVLLPPAGALGAAIVNKEMIAIVSIKDATILASVGTLVTDIIAAITYLQEKRRKQVQGGLEDTDRHIVDRPVAG